MNGNRTRMVLVTMIKGTQDVFNKLKSEYIFSSAPHRLFQGPNFVLIQSDKGQIKLYNKKKLQAFLSSVRRLPFLSWFLKHAAATLFCAHILA